MTQQSKQELADRTAHRKVDGQATVTGLADEIGVSREVVWSAIQDLGCILDTTDQITIDGNGTAWYCGYVEGVRMLVSPKVEDAVRQHLLKAFGRNGGFPPRHFD